MILVFLTLSLKRRSNPGWSDSEAETTFGILTPPLPSPRNTSDLFLDVSRGGRLTASQQLLSLWEPCCGGNPPRSVKACQGVTPTTPPSRASRARGCTGTLEVDPKRHVHLMRGETEAQRGKGLGLRLHSQL